MRSAAAAVLRNRTNHALSNCCRESPSSPTKFNFTDYQAMQLGAASIADYVRLTGVLRMPLEFVPGVSYHYSNPGYSIVGYIIEKVGGSGCCLATDCCVALHGTSTASVWGGQSAAGC
jgi:hypothetical protein